MKIKNIVTVLLFTFIFASCAPTVNVVPTETGVPTETATLTPILLTPTITPTATITSIPPTPTITPTPAPENIADAKDLSKWVDTYVQAYGGKVMVNGVEMNANQLTDGIRNNSDKFVQIKQVDGVEFSFLVVNNIPLAVLTYGEGGKWEETTLGNVGLLNGLMIGISYGYYSEPGVRENAAKFNTVYVCYDLGWRFNEKEQGQVSFTDSTDWAYADREVQYAIDHNQKIMGGHLLDWSTYPEWLKKGIEENKFSSDQVKDFIKKRITSTMQHFGAKVPIWTVVNEFHPLSLGWHKDALQKSIGDYTVFAFQAAREANPNAILLLNDGGNETPQLASYKSDMVRAKSLFDKGLIDGMGLQMHILQYDNHIPTYSEILTTINAYKSLGIPVYLTELDVNLQNITGTDGELIATGIDPKTVSPNVNKRDLIQATIIGNIIKASIDSKNVTLISFFNIGDQFSWLKTIFGWENADSTLFNRQMKPKLAYYEVLGVLFEHVP